MALCATACPVSRGHFVSCPFLAAGAIETSYSFHVGYFGRSIGMTSASNAVMRPMIAVWG